MNGSLCLINTKQVCLHVCVSVPLGSRRHRFLPGDGGRLSLSLPTGRPSVGDAGE